VEEKRVHPRAAVVFEVVCEDASGTSFTGQVMDLSLGGIFVEAEQSPPFGSKLIFVGKIPGMAVESRLPGTVRWTKPGGFGVQFGPLGARETHAITELMRG
jgi:type IV pilus assembly protein PilZ